MRGASSPEKPCVAADLLGHPAQLNSDVGSVPGTFRVMLDSSSPKRKRMLNERLITESHARKADRLLTTRTGRLTPPRSSFPRTYAGRERSRRRHLLQVGDGVTTGGHLAEGAERWDGWLTETHGEIYAATFRIAEVERKIDEIVFTLFNLVQAKLAPTRTWSSRT